MMVSRTSCLQQAVYSNVQDTISAYWKKADKKNYLKHILKMIYVYFILSANFQCCHLLYSVHEFLWGWGMCLYWLSMKWCLWKLKVRQLCHYLMIFKNMSCSSAELSLDQPSSELISGCGEIFPGVASSISSVNRRAASIRCRSALSLCSRALGKQHMNSQAKIQSVYDIYEQRHVQTVWLTS